MVGLLTGPERLPPKSLMPLWRNDFSNGRRRSTRALALAWLGGGLSILLGNFVSFRKKVALDCESVGAVDI